MVSDTLLSCVIVMLREVNIDGGCSPSILFFVLALSFFHFINNGFIIRQI